jgi:hypothetical protein
MAKQTFTTGQVLTAAQMTSLQQTAMLGGAASAKTASYTLVATDAGTAISMSNASATTITVNTALFAAGDTVQITNLGAGVCTITAGTATVNTAASLALAQYESGTLDFTSTSAAIFIKGAGGAAGGGGKVLQVVSANVSSLTTINTTTFTDTALSLAITPTLNTSKVLVFCVQNLYVARASSGNGAAIQLLRGASVIHAQAATSQSLYMSATGATGIEIMGMIPLTYLDSPATTSSTTYKIQARLNTTANSGEMVANNAISTITLLEIGA